METAIILLAVAGWYYNRRLEAANAYALGQCAVFRETVKTQAARKPAKAKRRAAAAPSEPASSMYESSEVDEDPSAPVV